MFLAFCSISLASEATTWDVSKPPFSPPRLGGGTVRHLLIKGSITGMLQCQVPNCGEGAKSTPAQSSMAAPLTPGTAQQPAQGHRFRRLRTRLRVVVLQSGRLKAWHDGIPPNYRHLSRHPEAVGLRQEPILCCFQEVLWPRGAKKRVQHRRPMATFTMTTIMSLDCLVIGVQRAM